MMAPEAAIASAVTTAELDGVVVGIEHQGLLCATAKALIAKRREEIKNARGMQ
jgi:hypothetical protein